MMTRRRKYSLLGLLFLALLLIIIWILYALLSGGPVSEVDTTPSTQEQVEEPEIIPDRPTVSEQELEDEREERNNSSDVISLSKTFVERYGSYSNEADFANLEDVMPLMTDEFEAQTKEFIAETEAPAEYYGMSTNVITVEVTGEDEDAGTASVLVNTQREEATGSPQNTSVKYQEIELEFVKESGSWKIDSATWL